MGCCLGGKSMVLGRDGACRGGYVLGVGVGVGVELDVGVGVDMGVEIIGFISGIICFTGYFIVYLIGWRGYSLVGSWLDWVVVYEMESFISVII